ncbi:MAG: large conductance mechanosensitive channel protein MscL [Clostridia bacterium]|nr:large conductance mechanosensitive channel protein MscL [Clostridia bacterium]
MKKFFKEFKDFISRGNVIDLAVGVIIGGAFTAIVTALTTNILRPLINWIIYLCGGGEGIAAYTFLVGSAEDMDSAIYIDWGAFISAIINFILIALVLFLIIKAINKAKSGLGKVKKGFLILLNPEVRALRKEGKSWAEIREIDQKLAAEKQAADEKAAAEAAAIAEANKPETILKEIRDLLKEKK